LVLTKKSYLQDWTEQKRWTEYQLLSI